MHQTAAEQPSAGEHQRPDHLIRILAAYAIGAPVVLLLAGRWAIWWGVALATLCLGIHHAQPAIASTHGRAVLFSLLLLIALPINVLLVARGSSSVVQDEWQVLAVLAAVLWTSGAAAASALALLQISGAHLGRAEQRAAAGVAAAGARLCAAPLLAWGAAAVGPVEQQLGQAAPLLPALLLLTGLATSYALVPGPPASARTPPVLLAHELQLLLLPALAATPAAGVLPAVALACAGALLQLALGPARLVHRLLPSPRAFHMGVTLLVLGMVLSAEWTLLRGRQWSSLAGLVRAPWPYNAVALCSASAGAVMLVRLPTLLFPDARAPLAEAARAIQALSPARARLVALATRLLAAALVLAGALAVALPWFLWPAAAVMAWLAPEFLLRRSAAAYISCAGLGGVLLVWLLAVRGGGLAALGTGTALLLVLQAEAVLVLPLLLCPPMPAPELAHALLALHAVLLLLLEPLLTLRDLFPAPLALASSALSLLLLRLAPMPPAGKGDGQVQLWRWLLLSTHGAKLVLLVLVVMAPVPSNAVLLTLSGLPVALATTRYMLSGPQRTPGQSLGVALGPQVLAALAGATGFVPVAVEVASQWGLVPAQPSAATSLGSTLLLAALLAAPPLLHRGSPARLGLLLVAVVALWLLAPAHTSALASVLVAVAGSVLAGDRLQALFRARPLASSVMCVVVGAALAAAGLPQTMSRTAAVLIGAAGAVPLALVAVARGRPQLQGPRVAALAGLTLLLVVSVTLLMRETSGPARAAVLVVAAASCGAVAFLARIAESGQLHALGDAGVLGALLAALWLHAVERSGSAWGALALAPFALLLSGPRQHRYWACAAVLLAALSVAAVQHALLLPLACHYGWLTRSLPSSRSGGWFVTRNTAALLVALPDGVFALSVWQAPRRGRAAASAIWPVLLVGFLTLLHVPAAIFADLLSARILLALAPLLLVVAATRAYRAHRRSMAVL